MKLWEQFEAILFFSGLSNSHSCVVFQHGNGMTVGMMTSFGSLMRRKQCLHFAVCKLKHLFGVLSLPITFGFTSTCVCFLILGQTWRGVMYKIQTEGEI